MLEKSMSDAATLVLKPRLHTLDRFATQRVNALRVYDKEVFGCGYLRIRWLGIGVYHNVI